MVFSSLTFLIGFLPATLGLYFLAPARWRNAVLFIVSLIFYAWGEPLYIGLMIFSTVLDYCCGRAAERYRGQPRAKTALIVSMAVNLSLLGLFKYSGFLVTTVNGLLHTALPVPELPLPIGISFYTFQTMSYTIDVYEGQAKAQKDIIAFGAYVALFPQLIAGPIVRYQDIVAELDRPDRCHVDLFASGVRRFITGLGKKVLLANTLGQLWQTVSANPAGLSAAGAWLGLAAYSLQIYFDFSGYSDMAIGLGRMLGFHFLENFNHPYMAASVTDFWRRWHISLSSWFRDYVYIPLGGNRRGLGRQLMNIAIVWLLTGIWHGASWNYVLWGVYYGLWLIGEKLFLLKGLAKAPRWAAHVYALAVVMGGWVLFGFEDLGQGQAFYAALAGRGAGGWLDGSALYWLTSYGTLLALGALAATPLPMKLYRRLEARMGQGGQATLDVAGLGVLMVLVTASLISGSYNPFLYFRF